jgi:transcriptional regulator with XRE-family HTH domain
MVVPRNGSTEEFARRLCERLKELHSNRRSLAERMNVSEATVRNWENGKHFPAISLRAKLCDELGMSAEDLHLPPFNDKDGA